MPVIRRDALCEEKFELKERLRPCNTVHSHVGREVEFSDQKQIRARRVEVEQLTQIEAKHSYERRCEFGETHLSKEINMLTTRLFLKASLI